MGFLAPLYLLLGGAAAVPLLIHLWRRRVGTRVEFPAVRYLVRAEQENSRTLRIRNILLMLLRVLAVLALVAAAARPVVRWAGGGHGPTALAIVVDNSLSSAVVVDGHPLLDQFKTLARAAVSRSNSADRLWLITVDGRVRGGSAAQLTQEIARLEPIGGAGDPAAALARAASVVRGAGLGARQVLLLTDGQRSEWSATHATVDADLLVFVPRGAAPSNRAVVMAESRPTRWTPRGAVAARFLSHDSTTYRITLGGRTLARGTAAANEEIVVHAAPPERGWVAGTVELEPDELTADNTRFFAAWIGPAPSVAVTAAVGPFAKSAVDVLRSNGEIADGHDVAVLAADELTTLPALIVAPGDPVHVGAANRALERTGVPWRFGDRHTDQATVRGAGFEGVAVTQRYQLVPQAGAAADTLAAVGRDAWIVAGPRYVIVASPLTPEASTFPVRASFVPWVGAALTERLSSDPGQLVTASPGTRISRPRWADALEQTGERPLVLTDAVDVPAAAGTYFFLKDGRRVGALVVNAGADESVLDRANAGELRSHWRATQIAVESDAGSWTPLIFHGAARRSLVEPALLFALLMLLIEAGAVSARMRRAA